MRNVCDKITIFGGDLMANMGPLLLTPWAHRKTGKRLN